MTTGRTVWQAQDAAWWRRERVVLLGEEFGAEGPAIANWLECEAKAQNAGGAVKAGYATAARGAFIAGGAERAREIVAFAVEIGFLEDFQEGERTFIARIAAYQSDQGKGRASWRKGDQRDRDAADDQSEDDAGQGVTERDESRPVTQSHAPVSETGEDRTGEKNTPTLLSPAGDVRRVFDAWIESTGRTGRTVLDDKRRRIIQRALRSHPLDEVLDAVRGWRHSPHHRGENERQTVYNELDVLLRDAKQIEHFRDLERNAARRTGPRLGDHVALANRRGVA